MHITLTALEAVLLREAVAVARQQHKCAQTYIEQLPVTPDIGPRTIEVRNRSELDHALSEAQLTYRTRRLADRIYNLRCKMYDHEHAQPPATPDAPAEQGDNR